jgi:hypothetical protein
LARKRAAPPADRAPAPITTHAALQRLADLVGRGYPAARIGREAESLITTWSASLEPSEMQERMEEMHEQLAAGLDAAEEQASEMDEGGAAAELAAKRTVAALAAARDIFGRAGQAV